MTTKRQDDFLEKLRKRLIKLRKDGGLTQAKLAQAAEIDRAALANIETGNRRPTVTTLYKISVALKIKIEDVFKGL